jgi:hypothetical protein
MENGFSKCLNGHYYKEELASCPFCNGKNKNMDPKGKTRAYPEKAGEDKTRFIPPVPHPKPSGDRTAFGDEFVVRKEGEDVIEKQYREERKLVGWLVTYSLNKMGNDFRLYEGWNTIGRDEDCNITVSDPMVSRKHASILFRDNGYKIQDERSSHGTRVNEKDIYNEFVDLQDNDSIRLGETEFKFKSAL